MQMLHTYLQWMCIHILAVDVYVVCAGADAAHILAVDVYTHTCSACVCSVCRCRCCTHTCSGDSVFLYFMFMQCMCMQC